MHEITAAQFEVLNYLHRYRRIHHCSPVYREMAAHFGWSSLQSAGNHLRLLEKKGYIVAVVSATGVRRGYRVTLRGQAVRRGVSAPGKGQLETWDKGDTERV